MPDINRAYQWAIDTCNAPNIGYSQSYRNQRTVDGVTYYDCSSFISYALLAGGWDVYGQAYEIATGYSYSGNAITTHNEIEWLLALGWTEVSYSQISNGDVCWRSGHTEMVYDASTGQTMGAHSSSYALDRQVSITSGNTADNFTRFFTAGGATGGYGLPYPVICALCGNAYAESQICPNQHQVGGSAYGLFQWDGGRKTNFQNWLAENGYNVENGNYACEYLILEDDWQHKVAYPEFNTLSDFLYTTITDIDYLTEAFCRCWERAGIEHMDVRKAWAHKCYNYILAHANDSSITTWINNDNPTSSYLDNEQASLNNAVMLYRYFSSGAGGGGDTPSGEESKMPIWMYTRKKGVIVQWR